MHQVIAEVEAKYKKKAIAPLRSGDTVRVHQKVREGNKERIQIFEGLVMKVSKVNSLSACFTVRRIASGVGVEKNFLFHTPSILRIEVVKRSKVRRNYLTYMRGLRGKSARLTATKFDKEAINAVTAEAAEEEEAKIQESVAEEAEKKAAKKAEKEAKADAKAEEALKAHDEASTEKA